MQPFTFRRPADLSEASALLAGEGAVALGGGMSLLPVLKQRLAAHAMLVDLSRLPPLQGISAADGVLYVGAGTTHADVAASPVVAGTIPALAALAGGIGDPQVRNRGTLGGVLANADPAADYPAALLALAAEVVTDRRVVPADDFFRGLFLTALEPGEIITGVRFPVPAAAGYAKFRSPASRYAIVGVFVARGADGVRVAVTGAASCVFRVPQMERALDAAFTPDALAGITVPPEGLNGDIHAEPSFRAHLIGVMARRAAAAAIG